jgi:hypothetical protein
MSRENASAGKMLPFHISTHSHRAPPPPNSTENHNPHSLCKIHVHRRRHHAIVPRIRPVTPVVRQPPPDIQQHAPEQVGAVPFLRALARGRAVHGLSAGGRGGPGQRWGGRRVGVERREVGAPCLPLGVAVAVGGERGREGVCRGGRLGCHFRELVLCPVPGNGHWTTGSGWWMVDGGRAAG